MAASKTSAIEPEFDESEQIESSDRSFGLVFAAVAFPSLKSDLGH